jgi:hypothetical protein
MKVTDQLTGLKVAAGDPIMHIGLFIGSTFFMPHDEKCSGVEYGRIIMYLSISHGINGFRFLMGTIVQYMVPRYPKATFGFHLAEQLLDLFGVVIQIFSIILAHDYFFFTDIGPTCS